MCRNVAIFIVLYLADGVKENTNNNVDSDSSQIRKHFNFNNESNNITAEPCFKINNYYVVQRFSCRAKLYNIPIVVINFIDQLLAANAGECCHCCKVEYGAKYI